jgi:hypothetical protein
LSRFEKQELLGLRVGGLVKLNFERQSFVMEVRKLWARDFLSGSSWSDKNSLMKCLSNLIDAAEARAEVRGIVADVLLNRQTGASVGLTVDIDNLSVFMHASQAMGLCEFDEQVVRGLPVCGLLDVPSIDQGRFVMSLRKLYEGGVGATTAPSLGTITEGISWVVEGNRWLWLLPRGRKGFVDLTSQGLTADRAREMCGWVGEIKILGKEPIQETGGWPLYEVQPLLQM